MFLIDRPRHQSARRVADYLIDKRVRIKEPLHALFELTCAVQNEKMRRGPLKGNESITEERPLDIEYVSIDMPFFSRYFDGSIPYLKAGDLIFVCYAKGEHGVLVTEDDKQLKVATAAGVAVHRLESFLAAYV